MSEKERRTKLLIEMKRNDSVLVHFGETEVEIKLAHDNPSNKARIYFHAPRSVEILRIGDQDADQS